jgi:hypothetical protein
MSRNITAAPTATWCSATGVSSMRKGEPAQRLNGSSPACSAGSSDTRPRKRSITSGASTKFTSSILSTTARCPSCSRIALGRGASPRSSIVESTKSSARGVTAARTSASTQDLDGLGWLGRRPPPGTT